MTTNPTSDRGGTPVPPRSKNGRPARPAPARNRSSRQARQAAARRNRLLGLGGVAVVLIVALVVILVTVGGSSSSSAERSPLPAVAAQKLGHVQLPVLTAAASAVKDLQPVQPATGGASAAPGGPGASLAPAGGKPEVLYIGAEFCPICATERWPLYIALSHFGSFTGVSQTHSAVSDGNIPTLSFYHSTYTSPYLSFTPVETYTNQLSGSYYKTLQKPTATQQAIWTAAQGSNLTFPFIDMGGKLLLTTSQFPSGTLEGKSFNEILSSVGDNTNTVGADIDASAAVLTKYFCSITGQKPAAVCSAVATVSVPAAAGSGSTSPAG